MKRLMIGALLLSFAVYGEEVFVGYRAVGEINVGADETRVQSDVVSHASEARIEKTGPGTLQLWENSIYQNNAFNLVVKGGVFELLNGGVEYTPAQPTAILDRAAFRVDANSVTPDPDDATRVSAWHDVRETKTEAPFDHMWGKPIWEEGKPLSNVLPLLREGADGKKGVYFGGYNSGQAMKWCVNGNESNYNLSNIRHVFIVTSATNTMGQMIGANSGQTPHFHRLANPGGVGYFVNYANDGRAMNDGANLYVDGEWTDINRDVVKRGRQLLEIKFYGMAASGANFFSDRMISGRQGGEDLHEVAIFTNSLTEAECKKVQDYLLAKWNLKRKPAVAVEAADGGAFRKTIGAGETDEFALRGRGTFIKAGDGTIVTKALVNEPHRGDFELEGGSLLARNPGAMKVRRGDRFTSDGIEEGFAVTKTSDAGNDVAIEGTAPMTVRSVPTNVKRLRVGAGGKLHLGAAVLPAAASDAGATFINPGLEANEAMQTKGVETLPKGTLWHGWIASNNDMAWTISPNRDVFFLNKAIATDGTWGWACPNLAPEGNVVIGIKGACTIKTEIQAPQAGKYFVSFMASGRWGYNDQKSLNYDLKLVSKATSEETVFGRVKPDNRPYRRYGFEVEVPAAGAYDFVIKAEDLEKDGCATFDDFKMVKRNAGIVPNGDFEALPATGLAIVEPYEMNGECPGWEFEPKEIPEAERSAYAGTSVGIVPVGFYVDSSQVRACNELDFDGGWVLAMAWDGSVAKCAVDLPQNARAFRLRMKARGFMGNYGYWIGNGAKDMRVWPVVKATIVDAGGATLCDLGSVSISGNRAKTFEWPNTYMPAEGSGRVTLRLESTQAKSLALMDDIELVAGGAELIVNGNFETGNLDGWTSNKNEAENLGSDQAKSVTGIYRREYNASQMSFISANFSGEYIDGVNKIDVRNCASIEQDVDFGVAGAYELSFAVQSRPDGPNGVRANSGLNPIKAWLMRGGVKREIARVDVPNTNFVSHAFVFRVDEPGVWRFGLQGCNNLSEELNDRDRCSLVDVVSIKKCDDALMAATTVADEKLEIELGEGAELWLDFAGTQRVAGVKCAGMAYTGFLGADNERTPFLKGAGTFEVRPRGTVLIVR